MLDVKWIRENTEYFHNRMQKRGVKINVRELLELESDRRQSITLSQELQEAKNAKTKMLANARHDPVQFNNIKKDVQDINDKLLELNNKKAQEDAALDDILYNIPNIPDQDVPYGSDESMNKLIRSYKDNVQIANAKEHFEIGIDLGLMDFEQTAKICGSRFVTLKKDLARMARALTAFMIDCHVEAEYEEIAMPILVRPEAMYNAGQLPKFAEDSYVTHDNKYRLVPTGEVPFTNLAANRIFKQEDLPLKVTGYTECFRSEAGSAGKDTKGMFRNHQFGKVELVAVTLPEESEKEHEKMLAASENILQKLDLPYRVMLLCTGDMGFCARKTYDIEVWLPGQKKYREIASISNCGDFQARRMKARYKNHDGKNVFVHTLNGSGLPIGRTIIAILENYQNPDGSVTIPTILQKYMNGQELIKATE